MKIDAVEETLGSGVLISENIPPKLCKQIDSMLDLDNNDSQ